MERCVRLLVTNFEDFSDYDSLSVSEYITSFVNK